MPKSKYLTWIGVAAIALIYVLLRLHSLPIPLDRDEGVFGYTGQRILEGGLPYRDALDHKPPGVFYLYALALSWFPATATGVHLFLLLYNGVTLAAVVLLLRVRFGSRPAWLGGAFCYALFSASPAIQGFTASTEMLMILPITVCVLCAVAGKRRKSRALVFLSGASGAAAFWIKPTAATSVAFAAVYLFTAEWLDERVVEDVPGRRTRDLVWWGAGAAAISAAVNVYFYSKGLFQPFLYWSFVHNVAYTQKVPLSETVVGVVHTFKDILRGDFIVLLLGLGVGVWNIRERTAESLFVLGLLLFSFVGTLPGFAYPHYFVQIVPAVAVASGWALCVIAQKMQRPAILLVIVAAMLAVPLYIHWDFFAADSPDESSRRAFAGTNPFVESPELAAFLSARTAKEDYVFVFGSEPEILMQAQRKSSTPMVMMYPLTTEYPRYLEFQEETWNDIQLRPPAYILFANLAASLAWDGKAKLDIIRRVGSMIKDRYSLIAIMPIGESNPKLLVLDGPNQPPPDLSRHPATILVYRKIK